MVLLELISEKDHFIEALVNRKLDRYRFEDGLAPLSAVRAYRNEAVIDNYLHTHPDTTREEAEPLFATLLEGLYRLARADRDGERLVPTEVLTDDELLGMWDAFVLCTRPYWDFCEHYLGGYLHRHRESDTRDTHFACRDEIASLDEVMAYRHEALVSGFHALYAVTRAEAEELFVEVKKWLWLCASCIHDRARGLEAPPVRVDNDLLMLDEMWHLFILFSDSYHAFCARYFGFYVHHQPTTRAEKRRFRERMTVEPSTLLREIENDERAFFTYVYERLGRETLLKWHTESTLFA